MTIMNNPFLCRFLAASAFIFPTALLAQADLRPAAGTVVTTHQERLYVIPGSKALIAGYFTQIKGIADPLFSGEPSEQTAYFTFTFESPTALRITNGDITTVAFAPGVAFNIYFNPNPSRSWSDPASFATGQLVATYRNGIGTSATAGPVTIAEQASVFESSSDFQFQGHTYNFRFLFPQGFRTAGVIQGASNLGPAAGYPLVFALAGSHVALGGLFSAF